MNTQMLKEFPTLCHSVDWGVIQSQFKFSDKVNEELISNVSIVPYIGNQYVMIQIDNGNWELPGGTLEAGEHYYDALKREVMEELGGKLITYNIFGHFDCVSSAPSPYKPHIPHPRFVRIVGFGEVELIGKPLNPTGGEQVISVEVVDIDKAISRYKKNGRNDIAELYCLVHRIRNNML